MFAFPKAARLLRARDFTVVLREPELNLAGGALRIRARRNRMPGARLGLVVTKKGTPKASRRNRVKRIIRERFRLQRAQLPAVDIVVQVFGAVEDVKLAQALDGNFATIRARLDGPDRTS